MYSQGGVRKRSYQQITLNGESTCELDLGSCNLTIFHALLNAPLDLSTDTYDRVFPGQRPLVKSYMPALFGNDGLLDRWPRGIVKRYRKSRGAEPDEIISASEMAEGPGGIPRYEAPGSAGCSLAGPDVREATTMGTP